MNDDPILPRADAQPAGAEVIDLDGVRIRWGLAQRGGAPCTHKKLSYCASERRVWCEECRHTVENFDAFMVLVRHFQGMERDARNKIAKADAAMAATVRRRAAKAIDKRWMSSLPAISCPHCHKGLLPEDFERGFLSCASREYELARRKAETT